MLSDEQRVALNVALEKFIAEKNAHDGVVNPVTLYSEAMFAAGIAYAQTEAAVELARLTAEVERLRAENAQLSAINNGLQDFLDRAFVAHPNLDLDIEAIKEAGNG